MTTNSSIHCRSCAAVVHNTFVDLGMSPLANSYVQAGQLNQPEPFYPLHVRVCASCFLVQLEAVTRPEEIFSNYAYFSSFSDGWLEHARMYTDGVIRRFGLNAESWVVEIASNDGYLLQYFLARGIPVLGIEPAKNVAEEAVRRGIPTRVEFFGELSARNLVACGRSADLIIGNNVLAHVPDLNGFVAGLKLLLGNAGVITLEFPHLMHLMEENQFDTIYHEHFSYFSLTAARYLFERHGLKVFDVEELTTHGGSLRVYVCHQDDEKPIGDRVRDLVSREKAAGFQKLDHYLSFEEQVKKTKRKLLEFLIAAKDNGRSVVGYGAPAKGNTLLNYCGVRSDFVDYTVDRSPHKQHLFLPGTHIPIYHPEKVRETKPDFLLILPWNLKDEVMDQMRYIRDWGGQFVVPIPTVQIFQ
jgi:C-methyltransferase C-terminal domain/Putative zinc binding domain/Methyltransferase domain